MDGKIAPAIYEKFQLGRRNLTDSDRSFRIGQLYEKRKQREGGSGNNQYTKEQLGQNDPVPLHTIDEESVT